MQVFLMPNVNELLFRMQLTVAYQQQEEIQQGTRVTKEENQGVLKPCVGNPSSSNQKVNITATMRYHFLGVKRFLKGSDSYIFGLLGRLDYFCHNDNSVMKATIDNTCTNGHGCSHKTLFTKMSGLPTGRSLLTVFTADS